MSLSKENTVYLENFLASFEDHSFNKSQKKLATYQEIQSILNSEKDLKAELLDRLIKACTTKLKPDVEYLPTILNVFLAILKKREQLALLDLVPSAQAIVYILNSMPALKNNGSLKIALVKMCFETLLAFPDQTLDSLVNIDCGEMLKIIEVYCSTASKPQYRNLALQVLVRLLSNLSPETKETFVKSGIQVWFRELVPTTVSSFTSDISCSNVCMQALELLTDSLAHVDYSKNEHWLKIVECICNPSGYTKVLKYLFEGRNDSWYRLWIVLIKLLKTQNCEIMFPKYGSPINALLFTVEKAFKMDVNRRILAFKCWDALIDIFYLEINDSSFVKRVKLLLIPLRSSNAKVKETAEAKFNTFWRLIRKYNSHLGPMAGETLQIFIQCCFGHPEKPFDPVPVLMTDSLQEQCVQALVELFGHVNNDGCVKIPRLRGRLINTDILVKHWMVFRHALKIAIKCAAQHESIMMKNNLSCLWNSLLLLLNELPDNKIRCDMFVEVLVDVERLLQQNILSENQVEQICMMLTSMFGGDHPAQKLLNSKEDNQNGPIHRIIKLLFDPVMENVIERTFHNDLKLITNALLDKNICNPNQIIEWLIVNLPHGENSAVLWSSLVESIGGNTEFALKDHVTRAVLMWPLHSASSLISERSAQVFSNWKTLFSSCANMTQYDYDEMLNLVQKDVENRLSVTAVNFKMCVAQELLKQFAVKKKYEALLNGIVTLNSLLDCSIISSYKDIEHVFPMLLHTLELIINTLNDSVHVTIAEKMLSILHVLINLTADDELPSKDIKRSVLKPLYELFRIDDYLHLKHLIADDLIKYLAPNKQTSQENYLLEILKIFVNKCKDDEKEFRTKVEFAICHANNLAVVNLCKNDDLVLKKIDIYLQKDTPVNNIDIDNKSILTGNDETIREKNIDIKSIAVPKVTLTPVKINTKMHAALNLLLANKKPSKQQTKQQSKTTPSKIVNIRLAKNDSIPTTITPVKTIEKEATKSNTDVSKNTHSKNVTPDIETNDILSNVEVPDNRDDTRTKPNGSTSRRPRKESKFQKPTILTKRNVDKSETVRNKSDLIHNSCSLDVHNTQNNVVTPKAITTEKVTTTIPADELTPEAALAQMFQESPQKKNDFLTPNNIDARKNSKKKEPSIVKTVVENGEEFAVVNSHWKFNPRKLTEHQKEKLREKREDIPALYQDYSQSQDGIKLATWNTDSQDTFTTKSNSISNNDISDIINNLRNSDVIPKIMENIHSKISKEGVNDNETSKKLEESPAVNSPKTTRMSLKDKINKNKRHLMVKSGLQDDKTPTKSVVDDTNLKTPKSNNVTNSAPPKICYDKPSRVIKTPKKFDDSDCIFIKKRKRSVNVSESQLPVKGASSQSTTFFVVDAPLESVPTVPVSLNTEDTQASQLNIMEKIPATENSTTEVVTELINKKHSESTTVKHNDVVNVTPVTETNKFGLPADSSPNPLTPKSATKQSRILKQLAIDMVEGHPLPQFQTPPQATKRFVSARKRVPTDKKYVDITRNEQSAESNGEKDHDSDQTALKTKLDTLHKVRRGRSHKVGLGIPPKARIGRSPKATDETSSVTVLDTQNTQEKSSIFEATPQENPTYSVLSVSSREKSSSSSVSSLEKSSTSMSQDLASSEDIIESSQDSTITTISVKSSNQKSPKSVHVRLDHDYSIGKNNCSTQEHTQEHIHAYNFTNDDPMGSFEKSNEDIELPKNKSVTKDVDENDLTENMDTELFSETHSVTSDGIVINDEFSPPILINSENAIEIETQEIADADTEPFDLGSLSNCIKADKNSNTEKSQHNNINTQDDLTQTSIEDTPMTAIATGFSPVKDKAQKNKEFLNDTLEISPIKTLSPIRDKNTPSPETSTDYVVITLNSPVQSNGEPFDEKCDSPEVFTEDKTSPEKRDPSPPRVESKVTCGSPSSLSLKKNSVNVGMGRGMGRAAQIMGLSKLKTVDVNEEREQSDKCSTPTPISNKYSKILLHTANDIQYDPMSDDKVVENFLELKKLVPTVECSPSGPILKRKLDADDTPISPASKRKRVSFHDPPVSTTMAVHKYIQPCGTRSPQNSMVKRQERKARGFTATKSQKRLYTDFNLQLDRVLSKAIENFSSDPSPTASYSEQSSIEQTPTAEVVKTSELNCTDPICPDLLDCKDPISNIAGDLSSPAMKDLLIKELAGKVETVADLAKMTELEVNRLCIKAPKVKVAQQVLSAYAALRNVTMNDTRFEITSNKSIMLVDVDAQTMNVVTNDIEMQTEQSPVASSSSQTEATKSTNSGTQTVESMDDIVTSSISIRPDLLDSLTNNLGQDRIVRLANDLPFDACLDLLMNKTNPTNRDAVINRLLKEEGNFNSPDIIMQFKDLLCRRFQMNDLILLCTKILEDVHKNNNS